MYIKTKTKDNVYLWDITDIFEASIVQVVNTNSVSSFKISIDNNEATPEFLKEWNRYEFYSDDWLKLHEGFFAWIDASLDILTIQVSDNGLWKKKVFTVDKNYTTGQSIRAILQELLDEINASEDTGYVLESTITYTLTSDTKYSAGTTFLSILQDLVKWGFEFITRDWKLEFNETIGTDRTQDNEHYYQLYYNKLNPTGNNIEKIKTLIPNNIYNVITAKSSDGLITVEDAGSILEYWRKEKVINVDGDLTASANDELEKTKDITKDIEITPVLSVFNELNIWDLADSDIKTQNILINFSWSVKILEKRMSFWEKTSYTFKVSTTGAKVLSFIEKISWMEQNINKLLIK